MKHFVHLPTYDALCDASLLKFLPFAVRVIFAPGRVKQIIGETRKRALLLDAKRPWRSEKKVVDPAYQLRLRGKMHPFERVVRHGVYRAELALAYQGLASRHVEAQRLSVQVACYEELAAWLPRSEHVKVKLRLHLAYLFRESCGHGADDPGLIEQGVLNFATEDMEGFRQRLVNAMNTASTVDAGEEPLG